jgi:hypothetical protein
MDTGGAFGVQPERRVDALERGLAIDSAGIELERL